MKSKKEIKITVKVTKKKIKKKEKLFDVDLFHSEMSYLYQPRIGRDANFSKTGLSNVISFRSITKNLLKKDASRKGFS